MRNDEPWPLAGSNAPAIACQCEEVSDGTLRGGACSGFVTGYGYNAGLGNHTLELVMEVLSKPFTTQSLVTRVREMLDRA
jgi:hypothetical protein